MRTLGATWMFVTVPLVMAACADKAPLSTEEIIRVDSAGVEYVMIPGGVIDQLPSKMVSEAVLSVGGEDISGFPLSRIEGGLILDSNRIAVGDGVLDRIAILDSTGALVRTFGQVGEGPGEFRDLDDLRRRDHGELVVWDNNRGLLVVFDTVGRFVETIATPPEKTAQRLLSFPGFLLDGSFVLERREWVMTMERRVGKYRPDFVVDRFDQRGEPQGVLTRLPGRDMVGFSDGRNWRSLPVQLTGKPHLAVGDGRAFVGHGGSFFVQVWTAEGLQRVIQIDRSRRPATEAIQRAAQDSVVAGWDRVPFPNRMQLGMSDIPVGDSLPAYTNLLADSDGRLWIELERDEEQSTWVLFDEDGEPEVRIQLSSRLSFLDAQEDLVLCYQMDELDVPRMALYRVR